MTQYRLVMMYITSGHALVKVHTEWTAHRDHLEEMKKKLEPFQNESGSFYACKMEMKEDIYDD